jgi:hypothetical protein
MNDESCIVQGEDFGHGWGTWIPVLPHGWDAVQDVMNREVCAALSCSATKPPITRWARCQRILYPCLLIWLYVARSATSTTSLSAVTRSTRSAVQRESGLSGSAPPIVQSL